MDINKVTEGLNDICEEVGVCAPSPSTKHPEILTKTGDYLTKNPNLSNTDKKVIYAAELVNGNKSIIVGCYEDNMVTSCYAEGTEVKDRCCHTADKGGLDLTKAWIEHLKENGYKVKEIPVEK
jgi:hypothetical protein